MTQQRAIEIMLSGTNVFLTGAAGSGKTYVLNEFIKVSRQNEKRVAVTASTGIAATHLGGMTIHSWSGIGVKSSLQELNFLPVSTRLKLSSRISTADILIIDEISMISAVQLDMVELMCRTIKEKDLPFGGLQVILCGDFFQLPPISRDDSSSVEFAFKSNAWQILQPSICYLTHQFRQKDTDYLKVLESIRSATITQDLITVLSSRLNKSLGEGIKPPRLFAHNRDADAVNAFELEKLPGKATQYLMEMHGSTELVDHLKRGCLAPESLELKRGAKVIFVKNNPGSGYMNGTLGTVVGFEEQYPVVMTISGHKIKSLPESWEIRDIRDENKVLASISQIPLRLAWAITIHKSQGMSLDMAEINLSGAFAYGMGYVALSRVKSLSGLNLTGINEIALQVDPKIIEIDMLWQEMSKAYETNALENDRKPQGFIQNLKKLISSRP